MSDTGAGLRTWAWPYWIRVLVHIQALASVGMLGYTAVVGFGKPGFQGDFRWQLPTAAGIVALVMSIINYVSRNLNPLEIIILDSIQAPLWIAAVVYGGLFMNGPGGFGTCKNVGTDGESTCTTAKLMFGIGLALCNLFIAKIAIAVYVRKQRPIVEEEGSSVDEREEALC